MDFNKGTAMAELARRLDIPKDRVFAVGDHLNDLPMLSREFAGMIATPENAVPAVKQRVLAQDGYVSPYSHGLGVADALERFLDSRKAGFNELPAPIRKNT
jgi:hydroxymethylpyrimidine pyrophosphatase-like HAD family hydrolase